MSQQSVDWQRVEAVLDEVLVAGPAARMALLEKLCGHDPALQREVRSLVDAYHASGRFLETTAASFAASHLLERPEPGELPGTLIGPYRLVEEIGRGGMGTVWLAERADGQFSQRVALKLIKRGMDSDDIQARFRRERQILARLEHSNIARLLDGGVSTDGRPYFVMEFVAGIPLTRYCDEHHLPVDARLRLFTAVCRAVHFAHSNLIVHRDIKPSNVLTTESGEIKLLDFGVAKLLDHESGEATTAAPGGLLTPEYASPEQVSAGAITTATDVYQLGILLFELLTGRRPYELAIRSAREIERAVCESEPGHPSSAVTRVERFSRRDGSVNTIDPVQVGAQRGTTPAKLHKLLRGDLDAIVSRALRKEPTLRHPTALDLAEDVERHLSHVPLRFGGGNWRYRTGKFVQRHRARVAISALVTLLAVTVGSMYFVRVRAERDRAQHEAAKASESATLLRRFFQGWSPESADRGEVTADKVLDDAAHRAESELSRDPETLASILSTLGDLKVAIGQTADADTLFTRALDIQQRLASAPSLDLAATLVRRGRLEAVRSRPVEAEALLRRGLAIYLTIIPASRTEVLTAKYDLARTLWSQQRFGDAEALLRRTLRDVAPDAPVATELAEELGYTLFLQARDEEAAAIFRPTLERQRRLFGPLHLSTLRTMREFASALRDQGQLQEAEPLVREALEISRALFGPEHNETSASEHALAILLERKGAFAEAEPPARAALAQSQRLDGARSVDAAMRQRTLAGILLVRGEPVEAEALLRRALVTMRESAPDNPDRGDVLNRLAYAVAVRGAPDAREIYRQAAAFERGRPQNGPYFVTDGYEYLAEAARRMGDSALARPMYQRAAELYRTQLPPGHPYRVMAENGLLEMGVRAPLK